MRMTSKKRKKDDWDDGRVIAPMDGVQSPFGRGGRKDKANGVEVTKKERRAIVKAFFCIMLPRLLVVLLAFGLVALLMYLWLS